VSLFVFAHEQPQESGTIPVMCMNTSANDHHQQEDQPEALLHLGLAGLLPSDQKLVINPSARTAILFVQTSQGGASVVTLQQFSPNGMRVLVPLLQAYPNYCTYETLLANLFPLTFDEARRQLRAFGLRVRSVRSTGYLVEAIPKETA